VAGAPRAVLVFRVQMDLKFCMMADNDLGWVPFGRPSRRGEASVLPVRVPKELPGTDASPLQGSVITMTPCTWLGMTTAVSNTAWGKWCGMSSQQRWAIWPASFNRISPFTTWPNRHSRSRVQRADGHEIRARLGAAGLEAVVGAILVIARIGFAAIVRANTRFAPTGGGWTGDGACPGRGSLSVSWAR